MGKHTLRDRSLNARTFPVPLAKRLSMLFLFALLDQLKQRLLMEREAASVMSGAKIMNRTGFTFHPLEPNAA